MFFRVSVMRARMGLKKLVRFTCRVKWLAETLVVVIRDLRPRDQSASSAEQE
jgi:hypothetical protein